jgi:hypothetical protein
MICRALVGVVLATGVLFGASALPARAVYLDWVRQVENASTYSSHGVSADGLGNVYVVGTMIGGSFLAKYDATGDLQWTQQFANGALGVSADGLGSVYITGGISNDAYVSKYDAAGNLQWTRQQGTDQTDVSNSVSADGLGNVYITGYTAGYFPGAGTGDVFVSKYDAVGNLQWTRQQQTTAFDYSHSISADGLGNVYISGDNTATAGYDAFVTKYDAAGNFQWNRQVGVQPGDPAGNYGYGVSADPFGNVYTTGWTYGDLGGPNAGDKRLDVFVRKYDAAGNVQWTRQFGSSQDDHSYGISADRLGDVYVSGDTQGSLGAGSNNAFLTKYNSDGVLQWIQTLGASGSGSQGVSADGLGNVYIAGGMTDNSGVENPYVAKYAVPEPPTILLLVLTLIGLTMLRKNSVLLPIISNSRNTGEKCIEPITES